MAESSKALLDDDPPKPSILESLLLSSTDPRMGLKGRTPASGDSKGKPLITAVSQSQVLGKVKDLLGVMAKANEKLELDARETSQADYNIEVLTGNEKEYIEMDLLLGVADLHTTEALAAAEAAMSGFHPSIPSFISSASDTEGDSDENDDSSNENETICANKLTSEDGKSLKKRKPNKRPKIVVLNQSSD